MTLRWSYFFSHSIRESKTSLFKKHPFKKQLTKSFLLVELFYEQLIRILSSTFLTASSSYGVTLFSSHWRHAVMQGTSHLSQNVVTQNFQRTFTFTAATETNRKDRILTEFLFFSTRSGRNQLMMNFSFGWFWQQSDVCEKKSRQRRRRR